MSPQGSRWTRLPAAEGRTQLSHAQRQGRGRWARAGRRDGRYNIAFLRCSPSVLPRLRGHVLCAVLEALHSFVVGRRAGQPRALLAAPADVAVGGLGAEVPLAVRAADVVGGDRGHGSSGAILAVVRGSSGCADGPQELLVFLSPLGLVLGRMAALAVALPSARGGRGDVQALYPLFALLGGQLLAHPPVAVEGLRVEGAVADGARQERRGTVVGELWRQLGRGLKVRRGRVLHPSLDHLGHGGGRAGTLLLNSEAWAWIRRGREGAPIRDLAGVSRQHLRS